MHNPQFIHEAVTNLISLFEQKSFPEKVAFTILRRKAGDTRPQCSWSLGNQLLAICVGKTEDARTYLQWKAVGRYPKKGSSAFHILAPCTRKIDLEPDEAGDPRSSVRLWGFRPLPVFALASTEGLPLPVFDYAPPETPPLWRAAARLGLKVSYAPFDGRALGKYRPDSNSLLISSTDSIVYFHEVAHAVHNTFEPLRPGILCRAEITAELAAACLSEMTGCSGYRHSAYEYICHYSQGKDDKTVLQTMMAVLSDVEKIVGIIWNAAAEKQVDTEATEAKSAALKRCSA